MGTRPHHRESHDRAFFIYNHSKHSEEDDPKDAILYFYPPSVSVTEQIALVGGLIGTLDFCMEVLRYTPTLISLTTCRFALITVDNFVLGLSCELYIPEQSVVQHLQYLWKTFCLYQGSLQAVKQRIGAGSFHKELYRIWNSYFSMCQSFSDQLSQAFGTIPYRELPLVHSSIFLQASYILQRAQHQRGVIGGALLNKNRVLCTQLSSDITRSLLVLMPNEHNFPCIEVKPDFDLPGGVRLLCAYLTPEEISSLGPRKQHARQKTPQGLSPTDSLGSPKSSSGLSAVVESAEICEGASVEGEDQQDSDQAEAAFYSFVDAETPSTVPADQSRCGDVDCSGVGEESRSRQVCESGVLGKDENFPNRHIVRAEVHNESLLSKESEVQSDATKVDRESESAVISSAEDKHATARVDGKTSISDRNVETSVAENANRSLRSEDFTVAEAVRSTCSAAKTEHLPSCVFNSLTESPNSTSHDCQCADRSRDMSTDSELVVADLKSADVSNSFDAVPHIADTPQDCLVKDKWEDDRTESEIGCSESVKQSSGNCASADIDTETGISNLEKDRVEGKGTHEGEIGEGIVSQSLGSISQPIQQEEADTTSHSVASTDETFLLSPEKTCNGTPGIAMVTTSAVPCIENQASSPGSSDLSRSTPVNSSSTPSPSADAQVSGVSENVGSTTVCGMTERLGGAALEEKAGQESTVGEEGDRLGAGKDGEGEKLGAALGSVGPRMGVEGDKLETREVDDLVAADGMEKDGGQAVPIDQELHLDLEGHVDVMRSGNSSVLTASDDLLSPSKERLSFDPAPLNDSHLASSGPTQPQVPSMTQSARKYSTDPGSSDLALSSTQSYLSSSSTTMPGVGEEVGEGLEGVVDGRQAVLLYVQGHMDTILVLLLDSLHASRDTVSHLWKSSLAKLAELDFAVSDVDDANSENKETAKASYLYLRYDAASQAMQGTACAPVTSLANELVASSILLHDTFTRLPAARDAFCRTHTTCCYGHRTMSSETFFQVAASRSGGFPNPRDLAFSLDQLAERKLYTDHSTSLL